MEELAPTPTKSTLMESLLDQLIECNNRINSVSRIQMEKIDNIMGSEPKDPSPEKGEDASRIGERISIQLSALSRNISELEHQNNRLSQII
jgi:hypothetical protein